MLQNSSLIKQDLEEIRVVLFLCLYVMEILQQYLITSKLTF